MHRHGGSPEKGARHPGRARSRGGQGVAPDTGEPLRFDVISSDRDNSGLVDAGAHDGCTRYVLPADGACQNVFEHTCRITCTAIPTVSYRPGTGRIIGMVTGDGAPMPDARLATDDGRPVTVDAAGRFALAPGPTRSIVPMWPSGAPIAIDPRSDQDTEVTVRATGCTCCTPRGR